MKKIIFIMMISFVFITIVSCAKHMKYDFLTDEQITNLKDGIYEGSVNKGLDKASVKVTIKDGKIVNVEVINVLAYDWRKEAVLKKIPRQFVEKQSVNIDSVSGATGSVHAIKIAVCEALKKAME